MSNIPRVLVAVLAASLHAAFAPPARAADDPDGACAALATLRLPDVRITETSLVADPVPHCKAAGVVGREINFAVWLPANWNGKFVMGGAGGFAGTVENQAIAAGALEQGYATAGTDTGHKGNGVDGSWALGNLERIVNYGHLAVHRVTEVAKAMVRHHYGRDAARSYFAGCSNGGRQAMQSAQRYPDDFDGIIAGAPAFNFTGTAAGFLDIVRHMYPDPNALATPVLGAADRKAIRAKIVAQCDAQDGLQDDVLNDPHACSFDPKSLACPGANEDGCLAPAELAAVTAIYGGPRAGERALLAGYPLGGEDKDGGWGMWLVGRENGIGPGIPSLAYGFSMGFMRNFIQQDPGWSYAGYDLSRWQRDTALVGKTLNATDPDLSAFRQSGGKLLLYHGWSDSALTANATIDYVNAAYAHDAGARSDVRLFLLPGVLHCAGGPGPDRADFLSALDQWVESAKAPSELPVGFRQGGGGRKLCAYPAKVAFLGGDGRDPNRFACRE